ncbi:hypothetical protein GOP47_0011463 [Adiantum capillus-veneris]|uniref:Complex 1 LYR protein domain-containing protein n=1 Tax=Adiantum capillus-veneris TaxID=13818 RepID=A0A9D4ZHP0_ADICA|nr:hypothetical protein GOP47_0011463 [Adiantum capillus-veneris]
MHMTRPASVRAYAEVLRLVRRLPPEARSYYSRFARENFATYNDEVDQSTISTLLARAYKHSCWVLSKYGVDKAAADKLKQICK